MAETVAREFPVLPTFTLNLNRRVAAYGFRVCGR